MRRSRPRKSSTSRPGPPRPMTSSTTSTPTPQSAPSATDGTLASDLRGPRCWSSRALADPDVVDEQVGRESGSGRGVTGCSSDGEVEQHEHAPVVRGGRPEYPGRLGPLVGSDVKVGAAVAAEGH